MKQNYYLMFRTLVQWIAAEDMNVRCLNLKTTHVFSYISD